MNISKGYWGTKSVLRRFDIKASRTLHRWMNRETNPFPKPDIVQNGAENLWRIETILAFEEKLLPSSQQDDGNDFTMEA